MPSSTETIQQLQRKLGEQELSARKTNEVFSLGCDALDRLLPRGGIGRGSLIEWLAIDEGAGAGLLALQAAGRACQERKVGVVLDRRRELNPLAAAAAGGWELQNMVVVQAASERDEHWAADQALRSPAVGAVWLHCERLKAVEFRRWQLAAESGGGVGMLVRPAFARDGPSWADVRLLVEPRPSSGMGRRWRVEVLRCRGGKEGQSVELVMDERMGLVWAASDQHETHPLSAATELAPATIIGGTVRTARSTGRSASA